MSKGNHVGGFFALPTPLLEQIRVTAGAFLVLVLVGFLVGTARPAALTPLLNIFGDMVEATGLADISGAELAETIFANNLFALLTAICMGFLPYIRLSALELGLNALLLGGFAAHYQRSGIGLSAYLAGTLPHGVTELSALVIACASGLYLCRAVTDRFRRKEDAMPVREALGGCMRAYVRWIAPLLLISALLETFVTPRIFERFL